MAALKLWTWKQAIHQIEKWLKKMWYIYTTECHSAIKKEQNNTIYSNTDGPRDYHTERSQTQKCPMISLICRV